ncbi:two-component sensor histidine kinase [Rhodospirillum rubrum]|uniref:sensor histidine kinase NtrY-like n=1 Tax=Rhodospirillum rubrum TaxID=1085 RepID=UPI0019043DDB|nr:PAS domain-containing sensor histidine kinase [Rhodospirillum rubrum]MBK1664749.1 two-component sensor histidine kinase [Rhodospirillum rubrum]MBK1676409.1 two-component sensor histidine kinase [Rhodospirillum rubrum]
MSPTSRRRGGRPALNRTLLRLGLWARRVKLSRRLAVALAVASLISGGVTFFLLSSPEPSSRAIWILLNVDLVILLALGGLITRSVVRMWSGRRSGGSRLQVRLAVLFSAVAITPAILLAIFSTIAFQVSFQSWFDEKVSTAVRESQEVAEAYLQAHMNAIAGDAALTANDLNREWRRMPNSQVLNQFLTTQSLVRNLSEVVVFTREGNVLGRAGYTFSLQFEQIPNYLIDQADLGEVVVIPGQGNDRVRALVELATPGTYLYVGRFVDAAVRDHIEKAHAAVSEYLAFQAQSSKLQILYFLTYIVVSLLLLLAAIWVGITIANRLAQPIMDLIEAAGKVSEGNLSVRVSELMASDEVALLGRAFNRMTIRLESQQKSLLAANLELDERRRFTETVLAGVSAGVIGVDAEGKINLPNPSACALFDRDLTLWQGQPIGALLPEFGEVLTAVRQRPDRPVEREMEIRIDRRPVTLLVRVAAECSAQGITGFVFTFDDITELQSAQRKAAWADVARRIAHEIKNPLTPIQLSAERLKRKYLKQITDDPETFARCTETIIRHVGDIGQMVDEFSAFARMPAPEIRPCDLGELVVQSVVLQRTAYGQIGFSTELPEGKVIVAADGRQITQALTNLLKNAVEAIQGRDRPAEGAPPLPAGRIAVSLTLTNDQAVVRIVDNGRGLPDMETKRLTEPYVTTRAKGTGLGLAIVKKILEDHGGDLVLENASGGGAAISLTLPLTPVVRAADPGFASQPPLQADPIHGA